MGVAIRSEDVEGVATRSEVDVAIRSEEDVATHSEVDVAIRSGVGRKPPTAQRVRTSSEDKREECVSSK